MQPKNFDSLSGIAYADEERQVLGSILTTPDQFVDVSYLLTDEAFTNSVYKSVWNAMRTLFDSGKGIDFLSVQSEIEKAGGKCDTGDLVDLMTAGYDLHIEQHSMHLKELSMRRGFLPVAMALINGATTEADDVSNVTEKAIEDLTAGFNADDGIRSLEDCLKDVSRVMWENTQNERDTAGSPTGFHEFDARTGGMFPSDLTIIAADSSQGKTSIANYIMLSAATAGDPVACFSLEMTGAQQAGRLLSMVSGTDSNRIMRQRMSIAEVQALDARMSSLMHLPIYLDDKASTTIDRIITKIRSMRVRFGIKGAVVDFLQILSVSGHFQNQDMVLGECARKLKNIARELGIWVIAVSQLNRDKDNPEPSINRLRGSGQMNEAADNTVLLYRAEVYKRSYPGEFARCDTKGTCLVMVEKGRNSGPFRFLAGFDAATQRFYDLDYEAVKQMPSNNDNPF